MRGTGQVLPEETRLVRRETSIMIYSTHLHSSRVLNSSVLFRGERQRTVRLSVSRRPAVMAEAVRRTKKEGLEKAKGDLEKLIAEKRCHPILIR